MKPIVADAETTIRNRGDNAVGSHQASPFFPDNRIVYWGELRKSGEQRKEDILKVEDKGAWPPAPPSLELASQGQDILLIGHNLPFDLAYVHKTWPDLYMKALPHLHIWDTQQVAYLLSGHRKLYPSLDDESAELGLPLKDDRMKQYWAEGVDTPDIPPEITVPYLQTDLENTLQVFLHQWEEVNKDPLLLELVRVKMDDKLLTTMMTIYGMQFDLELAAEQIEKLDAEIETIVSTVEEMVAPLDLKFEFNLESSDHISLALFGGEYHIEEDVVKLDEEGNPLIYKSGAKKGQVKTRREKVKYETEGFGVAPKQTPKVSNGNFSTNDEYLSKIKHPLVPLVQRHRELSKDVGTYYRGYSQLVFPDGKIHPDFNHESTVTGRQSCSKPNLQNVSGEDDV